MPSTGRLIFMMSLSVVAILLIPSSGRETFDALYSSEMCSQRLASLGKDEISFGSALTELLQVGVLWGVVPGFCPF